MSSVIGVQPSLGATLGSSTSISEKDTPHTHTHSKTLTFMHTTITNVYSLISKKGHFGTNVKYLLPPL